MNVIGIDLAGKEENPTGICVLSRYQFELLTLYTDQEIVNFVKEVDPTLIAIDAPLSLPKGRCCLEKECKCAVGGHFRAAEREIRPYGRVLPLTFRGMKMLTMRGIGLGEKLKKDYEIIETHPRTSQKMLGFTDLEKDLNQIYDLTDDPTEHQLDAMLAAITGCLYLKGKCIKLGDPEEGIVVIPKEGLRS
ncbi:MAG TPA: DUF429 domain-containing protein [Methanobacterium sp.]|nr:DUF429 domain-containing protein [Methanobacterium sp.]